jgi:hypothetical protein
MRIGYPSRLHLSSVDLERFLSEDLLLGRVRNTTRAERRAEV